MMRLSFPITMMTRRLAALALVLWLGGVGCLLGCELTPVVLASDESGTADQETLSCPAAAKGDCCHSQPAQGDGERRIALTAPRTASEMSCCPLAGQSAVVVGKPRLADAPALTFTSSSFLIAPRVGTRDASFAARQRVPDRGSTYLKCCTFLI